MCNMKHKTVEMGRSSSLHCYPRFGFIFAIFICVALHTTFGTPLHPPTFGDTRDGDDQRLIDLENFISVSGEKTKLLPQAARPKMKAVLEENVTRKSLYSQNQFHKETSLECVPEESTGECERTLKRMKRNKTRIRYSKPVALKGSYNNNDVKTRLSYQYRPSYSSGINGIRRYHPSFPQRRPSQRVIIIPFPLGILPRRPYYPRRNK
jgi:hypothetical protein